MLYYALGWHPSSDNMGDDLLTLAAQRLLPRLDRLLDEDMLDQPMADLEPEDRVVALLPGRSLRRLDHWPPERHVAPVLVGVHFSAEDVWGQRFDALSGAGLKALAACAPIGCRDERTAALLDTLRLPHEVTACLTLTLDNPAPKQPRHGIVCCDVPRQVVSAIQERSRQVRVVSHGRDDAATADFSARMEEAKALLSLYAGAELVITRRLHCAMVCLAVETPVLLLYQPSYEDVHRFAPMDGMVRTETVEAFLQQLKQKGLPEPWKNPADMPRIRQKLREAVAEGLARAETMPLPLCGVEEAIAWRTARLRRMADSAAEKIHRLENERYEGLHEKFALLVKEDTAKTAALALLRSPDVQRSVAKTLRRRQNKAYRWLERLAQWRVRRKPPEDAQELRQVVELLEDLGWPEGREH